MESRIRVCYCIDRFDIGGTELNAIRTLERLDPRLLDVRVFHLQDDGPLRRRYEALGWPMRHVQVRGFVSIAAARSAARVAAEWRAWNPGIVHCHDLYTNIFFAPIGRLATRARVITSRRWWHATPNARLVRLNRFCYRLSHAVLANAPAVASLLHQDEEVPLSKIAMIPNFIDDTDVGAAAPEEVAALRESWRVPSDAFVVGIVARLAKVKRHDLLLRAFSRLPADSHLVIAGDGPEEGSLRQLAADLEVSSRVHFLGRQPPGGYSATAFDVGVLCSDSEGFPNAVVEILAKGVPVVSAAVGGVPDIVCDGQNGILVPKGDESALARALHDLRSDPLRRRRLGASGLATVAADYGSGRVLQMIMQLYRGSAASTRPEVAAA
jgi:glycosyltransferase involved in cell wall biosynthesis